MIVRRQATRWTISLQHAVAASIAIAAVLVAAMWFTHRSTQAELRLSVEELRARAAEIALVARALEEARLSPTAARVLALQLRDKAADVASDVEQIQRDTSIDSAARASELGRQVTGSADRIAQQPAPNALSQPLTAAVQSLMTLERDLRPR